MKTNQEMVRKMGTFNVIQRTKDGMFNATELLKQWNKNNGQQKQMVHYTDNASTKEFINALLIEESLKERNSVVMQSRGKKGGTWMHPLLFIDFCMWLNPGFKVKVLKFVSDEMIKYRNEAGDAYKELSSAVMKIVPKDFMPKAMQKIGEALNWVIFNSHEKQMRNKHGEEAKQRELYQLEKKLADLINEGFIPTYDSLINYLRTQYHKRNNPQVFLTKSA
jgi:hypothetical protein